MNITDIDDKIIKRARRNHLMQDYISKGHLLTDTVKHITESLKVHVWSVEGWGRWRVGEKNFYPSIYCIYLNGCWCYNLIPDAQKEVLVHIMCIICI